MTGVCRHSGSEAEGANEMDCALRAERKANVQSPNPILTTAKHPDIWFVYDTYRSDHHSTMDGLENRQTVIQLRVKIIIDHTSGVKIL